MYNEVKINMIDDNCDCEYVISEAGTAITPFVYIRMYLGDIDFSAVEIRATYNGGTEWALPEIHGVENLEAGWYMTRLSYSDFSKAGNYELEVRAYYNGEMYGNKTLCFFHSNLQSAGEWNLSKQHGVIRDAYNVQQGSTASSGGGGGGGGGATYTAGKGIEISDENEIKTKIDNSTIQFNEKGEMVAKVEQGVVINTAIVVQEDTAKALVREYFMLEYKEGNKIGYGGSGNTVIVQNYPVYADGVVANGNAASPPANVHFRQSFTFTTPILYSTSTEDIEIKGIELELVTSYPTRTDFYVVLVDSTGAKNRIGSLIQVHNTVVEFYVGLILRWTQIRPPGYVTPAGTTCQYGCAVSSGLVSINSQANTTSPYKTTVISAGSGKTLYLPFASEIEYKTAVGMTENAEETLYNTGWVVEQ